MKAGICGSNVLTKTMSQNYSSNLSISTVSHRVECASVKTPLNEKNGSCCATAQITPSRKFLQCGGATNKGSKASGYHYVKGGWHIVPQTTSAPRSMSTNSITGSKARAFRSTGEAPRGSVFCYGLRTPFLAAADSATFVVYT